ncbi:MAG: DUF937 domain-containing protein [Hyphomicrobium aestuarii]|nr:DUF937 domain-containing protein [Hyphomicrobium aestuarii]
MNILDTVKTAGGGHGLDTLARSYGLEPVQLQAILATVLPALAQRMEANTLSRGGVADLVDQIAKPEHGYLLEHPRAAQQPWAEAAGIGVLDTIFGDKAKSRALAARAASQTGVSQDLIQKLLPILASLVMGALAKGSQGGLQDILKRIPGMPGSDAGADTDGAERGSAPRRSTDRRRSSQGGQTGEWGRDGPIAGSPDVAVGGDSPDYGAGSPLPLPGARIPGVNAPDERTADRSGGRGQDGGGLGDIFGRREPGPLDPLPDVIRRGDVKVDGDPLSSAIRNVLGSLLGFQSKGVMGWIIRFIVMRWGWGLLKSVLGRVTGR